jgi:hypothetical protein
LVKGISPTNKGISNSNSNKGTKGTKGTNKVKGTKGTKGTKGVNKVKGTKGVKGNGNNNQTQVCCRRCLMPKNSRRNRMMPPVAHSAAANQGTAT